MVKKFESNTSSSWTVTFIIQWFRASPRLARSAFHIWEHDRGASNTMGTAKNRCLIVILMLIYFLLCPQSPTTEKFTVQSTLIPCKGCLNQRACPSSFQNNPRVRYEAKLGWALSSGNESHMYSSVLDMAHPILTLTLPGQNQIYYSEWNEWRYASKFLGPDCVLNPQIQHLWISNLRMDQQRPSTPYLLCSLITFTKWQVCHSGIFNQSLFLFHLTTSIYTAENHYSHNFTLYSVTSWLDYMYLFLLVCQQLSHNV